jgi:HK97 family phage prohead protease
MRADAERASEAKPGDAIRFIASTGNVARDGFVIDQSSWQLDNYRANPVVLWSHDYASLPIGRAEVMPAGNRLESLVYFDQNDERARQIEQKYRNGFLSTVSVGWNSHDVQPPTMAGQPFVLRENELLDISCVSVPGDPGALIERNARALAAISQEFSSHLDTILGADDAENGRRENANDEARWDDTAILMMRLFIPGLPMSEHDRRRAYNRIAAQYRRAGKTAPEWMPMDALSPLGLDQLRGLFLENEPELFPHLFGAERAGAMISTRNRSDLERAIACKREAMGLVQGVLDRATKSTDPEPDPDDPNEPAEIMDGEDPEMKKKQAADAANVRKLEEIRATLSNFKLGAK